MRTVETRQIIAVVGSCLLSVQTASAQTISTSLCDFVMKASAAASDEFEVYKGAAQPYSDPAYLTFTATLSAPLSAECRISPRSTDGAYPPWYSCEFLSNAVFTEPGFLEASQRFDQMADQLRACLPNQQFQEETEGDPRTMVGGFRRTLFLREPGYAIDLTISTFEILVGRPYVMMLMLGIKDDFPARAR